jgi:hypothetical protein
MGCELGDAQFENLDVPGLDAVSFEGDQDPALDPPELLADQLFFELACQSSPDDAIGTLMAFFTAMHDYGGASMIADIFDHTPAVDPDHIHHLVFCSSGFPMLIDFVWNDPVMEGYIFRCGCLLMVEAIARVCPESVSVISTSFLPVASNFLDTNDSESQQIASRLLRALFAEELPSAILHSNMGDILVHFIDWFIEWVLPLGKNGAVPNDTIRNLLGTLHLMCDHYPAFSQRLGTLDVAVFVDAFSGRDCYLDLLARFLKCKKLLAAQFPGQTHFTIQMFFHICGLSDRHLTLVFAIVGHVIAGSIPVPDDYKQTLGNIWAVVMNALADGSFEVKMAAASLLRSMLDVHFYPESSEVIYNEVAPLLHDLMEGVDDFSCALPVLALFSWFLENPDLPEDDDFNRWILPAFAELELNVEFHRGWDDNDRYGRYRAAILAVIEDAMLTNAE